MDEDIKYAQPKRGINTTLIAGMLVGVIAIGGIILLLLRRPSMEDQEAQKLVGALTADSPGFAEINKDILISTDDNTVESPTGMGIAMYIKGRVKNKGTKNITVLQVNVAVIDQQNKPIREKNVLVVPVQQPSLPAGETIPITLSMEGFDRKDDRANIRWKVIAIKTE